MTYPDFMRAHLQAALAAAQALRPAPAAAANDANAADQVGQSQPQALAAVGQAAPLVAIAGDVNISINISGSPWPPPVTRSDQAEPACSSA